MKQPIDLCCRQFLKAQECCTDNEGYGTLLKHYNDKFGGYWHIGCDLDPIDFCPWCGKKIVPEKSKREGGG